MTEAEREFFVAKAFQHARTRGCAIAELSRIFEHHDGTVVVHFDKLVPKHPTGQPLYVDSPSTVCVMIDRHTGECSMPEML